MLQLGKESEVKALGRTWTTGRLTVGVIESFRDWVATQEGDPFDLPDKYLDRLDPATVAAILKEAKDTRDQLRGFSLACPLAQKWLKNERGGAVLMHLLLKAHHPTATLDDALGILEEIGLAAAEQVVSDAHGSVPREAGAPNGAVGVQERAPR
ncbi:MAG: hypothetical protein V4597_11660 [Pseudomonadota bacterium]